MHAKLQKWGNPIHLEELLSRVTEDNLHSEIDFGAPVGREIW